jgi:hypothetical protein
VAGSSTVTPTRPCDIGRRPRRPTPPPRPGTVMQGNGWSRLSIGHSAVLSYGLGRGPLGRRRIYPSLEADSIGAAIRGDTTAPYGRRSLGALVTTQQARALQGGAHDVPRCESVGLEPRS